MQSQTTGSASDETLASDSSQPSTGDPSLAAEASRGDLMPIDPLLKALLYVAEHEGIHASTNSATSGLPLNDGKLTPELYVRAAGKLGMHARVVKQELRHISVLALPLTLIADGANALVLTALDTEKQLATVFDPLLGETKALAQTELAKHYSGYAIYSAPKPKFDDHIASAEQEDERHWFWGTIFESKKIYRDVLIASVLINVFVLANPLFVMNVYDRVVPNNAIETLWALSVGIVVLYLFDFTLKLLRSYFIELAGKKSDILLSSYILEKVLGAKYAEHPRSVGAFVSHLREFDTVRNFITSSTISAFVDLPFLLVFLVVMAYIGGAIVWVPVALIPLIVVYAWFAQRRLRSYVANTFSASAQKNSTLVEALANLEAVKTCNAEGALARKWDVAIGQLARWGLKSRVVSNSATSFSGFVQQLGAVFIVVVGVYLIGAGELTQGALIACVILGGRVLAPLAQISGLMVQYYQSKLALDSLDELVKKPQEQDGQTAYLQDPEIQGDIEFRAVNFTYPEEQVPSLRDVTLSIKAGEKVAVIGKIGSGKSTLQKLILSLYSPSSGNVLLDGVDIGQYNPADCRAQIGYASQDTQLFFGSVRDNIMFGNTNKNDKELLRVAQVSGVAQWVSQHPLAFERMVGERGENLSGGQRQSLNIARSLVGDPKVLILDEPTAAMDNASEAQFIRRLKDELNEKTLLLVTHKVALLDLVERVIVIDKGKIIADGKKDAVLNALKSGQLHV